jgi:hypothetical protein
MGRFCHAGVAKNRRVHEQTVEESVDAAFGQGRRVRLA